VTPQLTPPRVGKHLKRYREIAGVLADEGLDTTIDRLGLRRFVPPRFSRHNPDGLPTEVHIRHAIERLGPTFVKIGQALSARPDLVPDPLLSELRKLQDEVPPFPFDEVRALIEAEFEAPLDEVFAEFDPVPVASASLGQVHKATLPTGEKVAVKVQRPRVREIVETDIDIFMTQARWVADHTYLGAGIDIVAIAAEFSHAIREELDYLTEGDNAQHIRRALGEDDTVVIPSVYWDYTTTRVLTLEWIEGVRLNRLAEVDAAGYDRALLAERGIVSYLRQIFQVGVFHADPHPGNLFALPGNRVGFTDFGRVGRVSQRSREKLADLLVGAVDHDAPLAADALLDMTTSPEAVDEAEVRQEVARIIDRYHGVELRRIDIGEIVSDVTGLIRDQHLGVPSDFVVLLATFAVLQGIGRELDPDFDFAAAAAPYAKELVGERMQPSRLFEQASRTVRRLSRTMGRLPDSIDMLARLASRGELKMGMRLTDYDDLMERMYEMADRLAFALIVAAFVIGFSQLLTVEWLPNPLRVFATLALTSSAFVGAWFFLRFVWHRRRRP
jgi:ubiquinone biosynthesis protein